MERYFIFCKNDFGLSNIFDPAQSKAVKTKVSDPAKNAKKPIIYCVLVKIFLRTNLIYKDFCVACNFGIPREKKNNDDVWLCSSCEKLDTTLKLYPNSNIQLPAYIHFK